MLQVLVTQSKLHPLRLHHGRIKLPDLVLSRLSLRVLISTAIALFMIVAAPACWFGALGRAVASRTAPPSSANQNEEHGHDEEADGEEIVESIGMRPPLRSQRVKLIDPVSPAPVAEHELLRDHLVSGFHPFHEVAIRRLI